MQDTECQKKIITFTGAWKSAKTKIQFPENCKQVFYEKTWLEKPRFHSWQIKFSNYTRVKNILFLRCKNVVIFRTRTLFLIKKKVHRARIMILQNNYDIWIWLCSIINSMIICTMICKCNFADGYNPWSNESLPVAVSNQRHYVFSSRRVC